MKRFSIIILSITYLVISLVSDVMASDEKSKECVILLHGLARTEKSMGKMAKALEGQHYKVVNYAYPSRRHDIATLATEALPAAVQQCESSQPINFVTHSMGGTLLRYFLAHHTIPNFGRAVMLAPPNQGSELVDKLARVPGYRLINGPAGDQLGTKENAIYLELPPVNFPLGVIAGSRSFNPLYSNIIPGIDDGKVSVENTKVAGMSDHIVLDTSHTFLMKNKLVIRQTKHFLSKGSFEHQ